MIRGKKRTAAVAATTLMVCGGLVAAPLAAEAQTVKSSATASAGSVNVTTGIDQLLVDSMASCAADGPKSGKSAGGTVGKDIVYGTGESSCGRTPDGIAVAQVTGSRFKTTILQAYGGPSIGIRSFAAKCSTTKAGSLGYIELGVVEGFTVPDTISPNTAIIIQAKNPTDPPLARVVLNELVAPSPPDGSLTTNTVHIKLFPQGGPISGDIVVGTASCDPYGIRG